MIEHDEQYAHIEIMKGAACDMKNDQSMNVAVQEMMKKQTTISECWGLSRRKLPTPTKQKSDSTTKKTARKVISKEKKKLGCSSKMKIKPVAKIAKIIDFF
jgi:hypothetical protein